MFLILPNSLTNFVIQKYYKNEFKFKSVDSQFNKRREG